MPNFTLLASVKPSVIVPDSLYCGERENISCGDFVVKGEIFMQ